MGAFLANKLCLSSSQLFTEHSSYVPKQIIIDTYAQKKLESVANHLFADLEESGNGSGEHFELLTSYR